MAQAKLTTYELQAAVDAVARHGSQTKAAKALGIPRNTLQGRVRGAETAGITAATSAEHDAILLRDREILSLKDKIGQLEYDMKALHREQLTVEKVREGIFGLSNVAVKPPSWTIKPGRSAKTTGVPSSLWSDWHWGEVVDPTQVNGVNSYNMTIARSRARRLVERIIDLCKRHMTQPDYEGIVINLGGDMLSGDIHDELTETNEVPMMPAFVDLFGVLAWGLRTMADEFGAVYVPCVVGNHGRTTHKPRLKNQAYTNYDWLLYTMLEEHFKAAGDERVQFYIPPGADALYQIHGHRFLLTHGNTMGVKGGDGIIGALGPILRGDIKIRNSNTQMGKAFDTLLVGHWHQLLALFPRLCVNGSLKGYDEFAMLMLRAAPEEPKQALWFTHPKYGITCSWPVLLGERSDEAVKSEWVSWPKEASKSNRRSA